MAVAAGLKFKGDNLNCDQWISCALRFVYVQARQKNEIRKRLSVFFKTQKFGWIKMFNVFLLLQYIFEDAI